MRPIADLILWATILGAAGIAWALLWSDAMDRRRNLRAQHDAKWGCACACPGLRGFHSHERCQF